MNRVALAASAIVVVAGGFWIHAALESDDSGPRVSEQRSAAGPSGPQVTSGSAQLQSEAQRVFGSFAGTKEQQGAAEVLQAWALNGAMDRCMEAAGYPEWDWSRTRNAGFGPAEALSASLLFAEPDRLTVGESAVATRAARDRELALMAESPTGAYSEAIGTCLEEPENRAGSTRGDAGQRTITRLTNRWYEFVRNLDRYGDRAAYEACMEATDLDLLSESGEPVRDAWAALWDAYPSSTNDIPESVTAPDASGPWKRAVALEQRFVDASWTCRAATYNDHAADALQDIQDFESTWAEEIDAASNTWDLRVSEAQELGYDPATDTISDP